MNEEILAAIARAKALLDKTHMLEPFTPHQKEMIALLMVEFSSTETTSAFRKLREEMFP
jgi:hypothetical protein